MAHAAGQAAVWRMRRASAVSKMSTGGRRLQYELNQDTIYNPTGAATLLFLGTCVLRPALPCPPAPPLAMPILMTPPADAKFGSARLGWVCV